MFQKINAIKQEGEKSINLTFIIGASDEAQARLVLEGFAIIILGVSTFEEDPTKVSNTIVQFTKDDQMYEAFVNSTSYEKTCEDFMLAGFDVKKIDSINRDLDGKVSNDLISSLDTKIKSELAIKKQQQEEERLKDANRFRDVRQEKILAIVEESIDDVANFKERAIGVAGNDLKRLDEMVEEIKKLRMGSNTEKIVQALDQLFLLMEKVELQSTIAHKEYEAKIIDSSLVSDVAIHAELTKYKKAQKAFVAGTNKTNDDNYYITTGKVGIFLKFIKNDFSNKLTHITNVIGGIMQLLQYVVIFLSINLSVYIVLQQIQNQIIPEIIYGYLIQTGTIGLAMTSTKVIKFDNMLMILAWLASTIVIYFILINFININFAL